MSNQKEKKNNEDDSYFYKPAKECNKTILDDLIKIKYFNLEVNRLAKPASNNFENFQESEKELFSTLAALIEKMRSNNRDRRISTDPIKDAQCEFDKQSKAIHKELCGLNK